MKIAVVGTGYVGLSNAILLSQHHEVITLDIIKEKIDLINCRKSPIIDVEIQDFLENKDLNLKATLKKEDAYINASFVIVATPTNYDPVLNYFDTSTVDSVISDISRYNSTATVIIKSTIPVGYTKIMKNKFPDLKIIFSPEFLREGKALYDNLYPSRIIVGDHSMEAERFSQLLIEGAIKENIPILFTNSSEAEAIKLFSNTYLAMRVAFFNELDTYSELKKLDSKEIIKGIGLDPRIGAHYNNPSFGYGGYCLPKDTKQLLENYKDVPQKLIEAIIDSNNTRKDHITEMVIARKPKIVGIYRLVMKSDSDNIRSSAVLGIIQRLISSGIEVVVYEPVLDESYFQNSRVIKDISIFKEMCDLILSNRHYKELDEVIDKVYTRDLFNRD